MNSVLKKHKLTIITIAYWFLLSYIIAALLWWFIALSNQNAAMTASKLAELNKDDPDYTSKYQLILTIQKRKTAQYFGEGISFMAVIFIGAIIIYRTIRKQIKFAQQQQNFMMAITHELKTPIAIAQLNIETLQKRKLDETLQQQMLSQTLTEIDRLNNLSSNILWAAQLDAGSYKNVREEIDLSSLVVDVVTGFEKRTIAHKISRNIEEDIVIVGDNLMLQILVNNLVENAIKYSPKKSAIEIVLRKSETGIQLLVKDNGVGIAHDERKKIFEKFYRTGNEATRQAKGTGLGLYLCKKICDYHKAKISVYDNKPQGSIFKVEF